MISPFRRTVAGTRDRVRARRSARLSARASKRRTARCFERAARSKRGSGAASPQTSRRTMKPTRLWSRATSARSRTLISMRSSRCSTRKCARPCLRSRLGSREAPRTSGSIARCSAVASRGYFRTISVRANGQPALAFARPASQGAAVHISSSPSSASQRATARSPQSITLCCRRSYLCLLCRGRSLRTEVAFTHSRSKLLPQGVVLGQIRRVRRPRAVALSARCRIAADGCESSQQAGSSVLPARERAPPRCRVAPKMS